MAGIGVITNPRSSKNLGNPDLATELGYILGEKGSFESPGDHRALEATVKRFLKHDIDVLAINGGDGTAHTAISAMVRSYAGKPLPKIMLLRGGTMNTVSSGLGISGKPAQLLDYLVTRYHRELPFTTTKRALLKVDGDKYGFLFGNGICAHFLEAYYEGGNPSPLKAATTLGHGIVSGLVGGTYFKTMTRPWVGSVEVDGEIWPSRDWVAIGAGTVDDIGIGFRPFYKGPDQVDHFHVIGLDMRGPDLIWELPRVYRAQPMGHEKVRDQLVKHMVLRSEQPISYMIDGDFLRGGKELTVEVGPAVEFILPQW